MKKYVLTWSVCIRMLWWRNKK